MFKLRRTYTQAASALGVDHVVVSLRGLEAVASELPWAPHIWMGVSVENRDYLWRVDHLRRTKAHIKFSRSSHSSGRSARSTSAASAG